jgi:hypothetical protein
VTFQGRPIDEIHTSRSEVEYSFSFALLEAARWRGISDEEIEGLDRTQLARLIAYWETVMQLQAVLRRKRK